MTKSNKLKSRSLSLRLTIFELARFFLDHNQCIYSLFDCYQFALAALIRRQLHAQFKRKLAKLIS